MSENQPARIPKLACQRCKRKKMRCDRGEPSCQRCITAKEECLYAERRPRVRQAQQRVAVQGLTLRLDRLERQVTQGTPTDETSPSQSALLHAIEPQVDVNDTASSLEVSPTAKGQQSWVYRRATDVHRNLQDQAAATTFHSPQVDDVMSSLNEALDDLGKLRLRTGAGLQRIKFDLSPTEFNERVDYFIFLFSNILIPDFPFGFLNREFLRALPVMVNSPYIKVDPSILILYYSVLHHGTQKGYNVEATFAHKAYLKILETVPAWLDAPSETELDFIVALLTSWTTISNQDYQLSWRFHCKLCHYIKANSVDVLDTVPAQTSQEETKRNEIRFLYYGGLNADAIFHLFYGKPILLRYTPNQVKPLALFTSENMHPTAYQACILTVWTRATVMTAEIMNLIDQFDGSEDRPQTFYEEVDQYCSRMEELIEEWNLERPIRSPTPHVARWLMADHLMNICVMIIGVRMLAKAPEQRHVTDKITLRAARKVISKVIESTDETAPDSEKDTSVYNYFITYYPFCSIFPLYDYILDCSDPDDGDCDSDIESLEQLGSAMSRISLYRTNFVVFAKIVNALNNACRTIQQVRREQINITQQPNIERGLDSVDVQSNPQPVHFDLFQDLTSELPNFDMGSFANFADISNSGGGNPHDLVRALEQDFLQRNWNESWWDMDGGVDMLES